MSEAQTPPPSPKKRGRPPKKKEGEAKPESPNPNQLDAFPVGTEGLTASGAGVFDAPPSPPSTDLVPTSSEIWLHEMAVQLIRESRAQLPAAFALLLTAVREPAAVAPHAVAAASALVSAARLDLISESEAMQVPSRAVVDAFGVEGEEA